MDAAEVLAGGRYRIERRLGRGGMGAVYAAVDTSTGDAVAVKVLRADKTARRRRRAELRFKREYHTLASLRHPRVIEAFDYRVEGEHPFYTMELLDGADVRELESVGVTEAAGIVRDVAAALSFLHARGLVHRDVSPRNVRLTSDGRAKLIDFGVLANVGLSGEVAGTVPYIAPESLHGLPVDGRTDIYSLGVLAYGLLGGRLPFKAKNLEALESEWSTPIAPLTELSPDVPEALDQLVRSMISLDPLGRPGSCAEVIDKVTAAAGLAPAPDLTATAGYLASAAMVGRKGELRTLRRAVERAARGEGGAVFIEAESGTGKSRLLREAALLCQIAGTVPLSVHCETAAAAPYGAFTQLLRALIEALPDDARTAARPHAARLTRIFSPIRRHLGVEATSDVAAEPAEERLRVQQALLELIHAVCARRPLVLLLDDMQRCDEASAAAFAALARAAPAHPLLVVSALRSNEAVRAPLSIAALRQAPIAFRLGGLDGDEVEELVSSLFGTVPHARRLSKWLHDVTRGSPLHCTELARHLVDTGVVKFEDGEWSLPIELPKDRPETLGAAMEARIERLSDGGRSLGEALSVHGGELTLELCQDLAGDLTEDALFAALDALTTEGVLVGADDSYRFRHDGLREALLRKLPDDRRRTLHRRVAETLAADELIDPGRAAEIGWHFLHGGEPERAAELLSDAGRRLFEAQAFSDCVAPLEAAIEVREARGDPPAIYMDLELMLVSAGFQADREAGLRHSRSCVTHYRRHSGLALADRLGPLVGRHLAFVLGVSLAAVRWLFTRPSRRGPNPMDSLVSFLIGLGFACSLLQASNHLAELRELLRLARPVNVFRNRMSYAAWLTVHAMPDIMLGRLGPASDKLTRSLEIIRTDRLTPATDADRHSGEAGIRCIRASLVDVNRFDPRMHDDLELLEASGLRYYQLVVHTTRVTHHRYRGEEERARQIEQDEIETTSLQLGAWSADVAVIVFAHPAYGLNRDVMGLKRSLTELTRLCDQGFNFHDRVQLTLGEYQRERGKLDDSVETLQALVDGLADEDDLMRQFASAALAETKLLQEDHRGAAAIAEDVIRLGRDPDSGMLLPRLRAERIVGLCRAELGDVAAAVEGLTAAIQLAETRDIPSMVGQLHEARARVGLLAGDETAFDRHANEANRWFRFTRNPSLISIGERLWDRGGSMSRRPPMLEVPADSSESLRELLQETVADLPSHRSEPTSASFTDADDPPSASGETTEITRRRKKAR